jgi:hypothetical protein
MLEPRMHSLRIFFIFLYTRIGSKKNKHVIDEWLILIDILDLYNWKLRNAPYTHSFIFTSKYIHMDFYEWKHTKTHTHTYQCLHWLLLQVGKPRKIYASGIIRHWLYFSFDQGKGDTKKKSLYVRYD